jgi:hypothetical protein
MEPNNTTTSLETQIVNEQRSINVSFLNLPRELREMIYKWIPHSTGVYTYDTNIRSNKPHWSPTEVGSPEDCSTFEQKYGNPGVSFGTGQHCFGILSTCRTIYLEARPILYAATPLGIWRPMYDYGGASKHPDFIKKVFSSLPTHASKHIRTLHLQGELWHGNMATLLKKSLAEFSHLKILEIGLDPYYDTTRRANWFDDRAILRQSWPAISTLYLVAQHLSFIKITISPPLNKVNITSSDNNSLCLSGPAYKNFLTLHLHLCVLRTELSIYGALIHKNAQQGMEFFMDLLQQRRDLFELFQGRKLVERCIAGTAKFSLRDEREWLEAITGRWVEVDEGEGRVSVVSREEERVKWCGFVYELRPRGLVE